MQSVDRVLELLYDRAGGFFALEELAEAAGLDRAGLEAALEALVRRGHRIERTPVHGVRLHRPMVLDAHLLERGLPVRHIGRHVICFREVDSTNDVAFDSAAQADGQALVVTAEFQRAGRGRMGRRWLCPPSAGVLASVLLHAAAAGIAHEQLTVAAGLAVAEGIEDASGIGARLVWPNDVLAGGAKVAGVLVEVRGSSTVIGFGINVGAAPRPEEIGRAATSLAAVVGRTVERVELLRAVLVRLDRRLEALASGELDELHESWLRRCVMLNRRVRFRRAGRELIGRVLDLHPTEGLVVLTDDGCRLHLPAAETTVVDGLVGPG